MLDLGGRGQRSKVVMLSMLNAHFQEGLPVEGGEAFILGISQHSHLFRAGWFRNVQAEQFQGSPSPSESCSGWGGGAGGTRAVVGPVIGVRGGIGGGVSREGV